MPRNQCNLNVTYHVTYSKRDRLQIGPLTGKEKGKRTVLLTSNLCNLFYTLVVRAIGVPSCIFLSLLRKIGYLGYNTGKGVISKKGEHGRLETVTYPFFDRLLNRLRV
jgi:hypothetical protein